MAKVIEDRPVHYHVSENKGIGAVGIIAIAIIILLAIFALFRWGGLQSGGTDTGTEVAPNAQVEGVGGTY